MSDARPQDTAGASYTDRLVRLQRAGWKQVLDVQRPYRWNLRRHLGDRPTLDVGCGIGRCLAALAPGSVGVDHNPHSVRACRDQGLTAWTTDQLARRCGPGSFDAMLAAHLLEHLPAGQAAPLLRGYLPYLRPGSLVMLVCPQQRGYASDTTHTVFLDQAALRAVCDDAGLTVLSQSSFPFPRIAGRLFVYNEFVTLART